MLVFSALARFGVEGRFLGVFFVISRWLNFRDGISVSLAALQFSSDSLCSVAWMASAYCLGSKVCLGVQLKDLLFIYVLLF